jgi:serine/threonine-protein kinase HipA
VFNVVARNQDDHTKNIAFLMDQDGRWQLSPAFDVIYSHNPAGKWTNQHQMSINGKQNHFLLTDIINVAESISIPKPMGIIASVLDAVGRWPEFAAKAGIKDKVISEIARYHRMDLN